MQKLEPVGMTLVDERSGFNEMSYMGFLCMARYHWPYGSRFTIKFYKN